ncbi:MAG: Gfo/Idh/MocA family oxidoreductase [Verrucomicrobiota bacterium]
MSDLPQTTPLSRRRFLESSALLAGAAATGPNLLLGQAKGANSRLRVGVMGLGRGKGHIKAFLDVPNTEIAYVCDVDQNRLLTGANTLKGKQEKMPEAVTDFRRILDDPEIDALSIAAPNFWHAPATILACRAGKHVYVEKPGSYSAEEAVRIVEVARETKREVQMGTQRRSYPAMIEAVEQLRSGVIGKLLYARCYYSNSRPSIGKGVITPPPQELDWELWQGPVPNAPYKDNLVHYNWHWHWHYGGGELANNGVHSLDVARWAMGVDYPERITCSGGRYHYSDDQETPDTAYAVYDYGKVGLSWESSSCHRRKPETQSFVTVYGEGGKLDFSSANYTVYDSDGKEIAKNVEPPSDIPHFTNFANAVREGEALTQPIDDAQVSAMLCHLGNIAYRTSGAVEVDPGTGTLVESEAGEKFWGREAYREGWEI